MLVSADSTSSAVAAGFPAGWSQAVSWMDAHSSAITAIATIVLVVVTAVYVRLTNRLVKASRDLVVEAQLDREWAFRPNLSWRVDKKAGSQDREFTAANNSVAAIYQCVIVEFDTDAQGNPVWYMCVSFTLGIGDEATDEMKLQNTEVPGLGQTANHESRALFRNQLGDTFNCKRGSVEPAIWPASPARRGSTSSRPPWVDWYEQLLNVEK